MHVNCKKKKTCSYFIKRYINTPRDSDIASSLPSEKEKKFNEEKKCT